MSEDNSVLSSSSDSSMSDKEANDSVLVPTVETIDYGHPIRMTFRFLDHVESGVPYVTTIRRLDYLDPEAVGTEFPEYSRWFMSTKENFDRDKPWASEEYEGVKRYIFSVLDTEHEMDAIEVIKFLPFIGTSWDYASEASEGEETGKMVPKSAIEVIFLRSPDGKPFDPSAADKSVANDEPTIIISPTKK